MTRNDWDYYTLLKDTSKEIDEVIIATSDYGVRKYIDRRDFVRKAVSELLDRERQRIGLKLAEEMEALQV
jgi:hypothetical protein